MRIWDMIVKLLKSISARTPEPAMSPTQAAPAPKADRSRSAGAPLYAVIDVETTGLSARRDRIIELAIVRTDAEGTIVDEWVTRFNPEGPVGATHIHGIRDQDVASSPLFRDLAPTIAAGLTGVTIVAHNARFDLAFLRAEFENAGWQLPYLKSICTMDASHHYLPDLQRRRLIDCCWSAGIELTDAHSALGDARAAAGLLRAYLTADRTRSHSSLGTLSGATRWPAGPSGAPAPSRARPANRSSRPAPIRITPARPELPPLTRQLTSLSLLEVIDEGAPIGTTAYIELLLDALEDGDISDAEATALDELREMYGLSPDDLHAAHTAFLLALAHKALDDGRVSRAERQELDSLAALLSVPLNTVKNVLDHAESARIARLGAKLRPLPSQWTHGQPLRVGDRVAFTGCDDRQRDRLERRAEQLGVRVINSVSKLTVMLITDDTFAGGKHQRAVELGTRRVHPDLFEVLIKHLQPAAIVQPAPSIVPASPAVRSPRTVAETAPAPATATAYGASPSEVRAWAATNGYTVGVRGRLPREVLDAFTAAREPARP